LSPLGVAPSVAPMAATGSRHPIVVGYDGSLQSRDALSLGVALARATGDPLLLVCAHAAGDVAGARAVLERVFDLRHMAVPRDAERRAIPGRSAAAALQKLAEAEHPCAVVLGSYHNGPLGRVLAASVAERLLHESPCPVAVAPRGMSHHPPAHLRTVCAGFDGGPESWSALQHAAQIAASANARLRILTVLEPLRSPAPALAKHRAAEQRQQAELELDRAAESVSQRVRPEKRLIQGEPAQVLAQEEEHDVDLLVLGSRGYGPVRRVLLGGVSTALVRSARCPVMVVPRSAELDFGTDGLAVEDELAAAD
jgi:nucleotide-binding universal stress UspA family protein